MKEPSGDVAISGFGDHPARHCEHREKANKRQPTGVPGISFFATAVNRRDGTVQRFFSVFTRRAGRSRNRRFCIDTLGREEAWRRALRVRAEHEATLKIPQSSPC